MQHNIQHNMQHNMQIQAENEKQNTNWKNKHKCKIKKNKWKKTNRIIIRLEWKIQFLIFNKSMMRPFDNFKTKFWNSFFNRINMRAQIFAVFSAAHTGRQMNGCRAVFFDGFA